MRNERRKVMAITDNRNDKVILLPKTIDYYQEEITRMLESERFAEAVRLLDFLLDCRSDDPRTHEEWQTLLDWLKTSFAPQTNQEEEEDETTETELHKRRFYSKLSEDPDYVKKLLDTVLNDPDLKKKMLAMEQLSVAEHPQIDDTLKRWAETVALHPLIQYKVLQTLRARGASGKIELERDGERVVLEIGETPLDPIHYPEPVSHVLEKVKSVCEIDHPSLIYFAEHTWNEFIAYLYGTMLYRDMERMTEAEEGEWAAALHQAVVETLSGREPEEDVLQIYKLPGSSAMRIRRHLDRLNAFIRNTFMS